MEPGREPGREGHAADCRILLFAKEPSPGRVKTRLAPELGRVEAARLYRAFLDDAVRTISRPGGSSPELWVAPPSSVPWFSECYPGVRVRPQRGRDLGERLRHAFGAAFDEGARRVLVVGSDHPTLPAALLRRGFRALTDADVVLGPSDDGGYYLVAIRAGAWPSAGELFSHVPWSTDRVLEVTLRRGRERHLSCHLLPEWYDVDEPSDLRRLRRDVEGGSHTARALADLDFTAGRGEMRASAETDG